jgi:cytochrome c oxidase subunit 1
MGMVAEIIANNTRKPLYGYKAMVGAIFVLGFLSFIVWAHHMYMTGMGAKVAAFFQVTTIMISVPSVILLTALCSHCGAARSASRCRCSSLRRSCQCSALAD